MSLIRNDIKFFAKLNAIAKVHSNNKEYFKTGRFFMSLGRLGLI